MLQKSGNSAKTSNLGGENRARLLGEFEYSVIVAIDKLGDEAYGAEISRYLLHVTGRDLALAQVYITLRRLENKGFLSSQDSAPRPVKGGRARKVFVLEDLGARALAENTIIRRAMVGSSTAALNEKGNQNAAVSFPKPAASQAG